MAYSTSWTRIGNSAGFRVAGQFFKDNPQFAGAKGEVEVIDSNTLLVRLNSQELEQAEDEQMLSLFLGFLTKQALANPEKETETYTAEMAAEDDELIAGVEIDD